MLARPRVSRAAIVLLASGIALAGGCRSPKWTPDPRVSHRDTAFISGGERITVERAAPLEPGRHPAILVLNPSDGTDGSGGRYIRRYADEFAVHGYVAYIVHYFDRTGTVRSDDAMEERLYPLWTGTLRDAVTFVQHDSLANPQRIGAFGYSLGGYMALALGASDPRVKVLVVLSGGLFDGLDDRITRLPPTLVIHGAADQTVPVSAAYEIDSTLARVGAIHQLVVYPGQGHGLSRELDPDAASRSIAWFDRYLRPRWWRRMLPTRVSRVLPGIA